MASPVNLSHSKIQIYKECPRKYKFQCVDKYTVDTTPSPLLFGKALDTSINYLLKQHKNGKSINKKYAKQVFLKVMKTWHGQNEFVFFKSEIPPEDFIENDPAGNQIRAWTYLSKIGQMMIDTYVDEILPNFAKVLSLQKRKKVVNELGDAFIMVLDCIVELKDGRVVLIDNKTASKPYPKTSVKKSDQLTTYHEYFKTPYCGYIVLHKKLKENKVTWQFIVDTVDESRKDKIFEEIDEILGKIKDGDFRRNRKSCYLYGKRCPFFEACWNKDFSGLIKQK